MNLDLFIEFGNYLQIRAVCLAISLAIMWIILFIVSSVFPILMQSIGLFSCMMIFGVMCLLNAIFGIFFVPETGGMSHEEIMQILTKSAAERDSSSLDFNT